MDALGENGWTLATSPESDADELMTWFPDENSTAIWGGPKFRWPFSRGTFISDCRWHEIASYALRDPGGSLAAFGQVYERYGRINLARLVAHPDMRGRGIGKRLVRMLMTVGADLLPLEEYSLYVYMDNEVAYRCYKAMGFIEREVPDDDSLAGTCYYMTRRIDALQKEGGT